MIFSAEERSFSNQLFLAFFHFWVEDALPPLPLPIALLPLIDNIQYHLVLGGLLEAHEAFVGFCRDLAAEGVD